MALADFPNLNAEDEVVAPRTVADGLGELWRSRDTYELLSNGVGHEIETIVSGAGGPALIASLGEEAIAGLWRRMVICFQERRLEPVLSLHALPFPRYPIDGSGVDPRDPGTDGPKVRMWDPPRLPHGSQGSWTVLGYDVGFPVGVPACELTSNADWIEYYARRGFNILTYRTVRNVQTAGSPYDWVLLDGIAEPWSPSAELTELRQLAIQRSEDSVPPDWRTMSTATSFLAPSLAPDEWKTDIREARRRLDKLGGHHILIVSVTDSVPYKNKNIGTLCADFVRVAMDAEEAGAHAVECYLARASTKIDGELARCERDVETSIAIVKAVRAALGKKTRLLIKLSAGISNVNLEQIVVPLAVNRLIDGISGISPVEVRQVDGSDGRVLWHDRPPGVAGYALHDLSRDFVQRMASLRRQHNLDFDIIAMGGVMTARDVVEYLELGATAVQAATAAAFDPDLAEAACTLHKASVLRASVETTEVWEGFVTEVDDGGEKFWARVTPPGDAAGEMDAEFEFDEVHPDQLRDIREGALLRWTTGVVQQGGRKVRQSSVRFERLEPPSEDAILAGKKLAQQVLEVFGQRPNLG